MDSGFYITILGGGVLFGKVENDRFQEYYLDDLSEKTGLCFDISAYDGYWYKVVPVNDKAESLLTELPYANTLDLIPPVFSEEGGRSSPRRNAAGMKEVDA